MAACAKQTLRGKQGDQGGDCCDNPGRRGWRLDLGGEVVGFWMDFEGGAKQLDVREREGPR